MLVVDDHLLLDVLAGTLTDSFRQLLGEHEFATTPSWYYRLSRALASQRTQGSLTRRFAELAAGKQRQLETALTLLPSTVAMVDARIAVPVMVAVAEMSRANLLTAEALAAALILEAEIAVSTESAVLLEAAKAARVAVHLVRP